MRPASCGRNKKCPFQSKALFKVRRAETKRRTFSKRESRRQESRVYVCWTTDHDLKGHVGVTTPVCTDLVASCRRRGAPARVFRVLLSSAVSLQQPVQFRVRVYARVRSRLAQQGKSERPRGCGLLGLLGLGGLPRVCGLVGVCQVWPAACLLVAWRTAWHCASDRCLLLGIRDGLAIRIRTMCAWTV